MIPDTSTSRGVIRCAVLLACALAAVPASAQQGQGFQHVLPEDTLVFIGVDDTREYGDDWASSSLGRFWVSDPMIPTRESIARELDVIRDKLVDEVGVDLLEFPGMLTGPLAFALLALELPEGSDEHDPSVAFCMLADVGERRDDCQALCDRLVERALEEEHEAVLRHEDVGGVAVTAIVRAEQSDERLQLRFGFHDTTLIAVVQHGSLSRDPFLRVVDGMDGQADAVLDGAPRFRSSLAGGQRAGMRVYADSGRIIARVLDGIERAGDVDDDEARMFDALGLRELGVLSMSMDCDAQGSTAAMRLDWPGEGWIQRILRHVCVPGDFPSLEYVSVDVRSFTALNVDLAGMFDTVSRMLIEMDVITPSDLVQFLTSAESEVGFNPRDDLLELLTGEFVFIVDDVDPSEALPIPGADAVNYALIVGLGDGVAFTTLVDGVIRKLGFHVGRKSEDFQGFQVYQVPMPITTISLGYAVLDDMAVLSLSPTMLRDVLRRKASADLPGITGSERYHEAVARVKAGYGMIGFSDTASDMKSLLRTLANLDELVDENTDLDSPLRWLARLPLPDESLVDDYFTGGTASVCTIDEDGIYFESAGP